MQPFMNLTKALSDENRVRILMALSASGELCVCHINTLLALAPSTVSKHLFLLKNSLLLTSRKDGRWMYYRLADKSASSEITEAIAWVKKSLSGNNRILMDANRVKDILKIEREVLCSQQAASSTDETSEVA